MLALYLLSRFQGQKLNTPLVRSTGAEGGDVQGAVLSPDGTWAVYSADQVTNELFELYSVPVDGSASARQLSTGPGVALLAPRVSADGSRVVYLAYQAVPAPARLHSVPIDGSAAPVELVPGLPVGRTVRSFALSPDGSRTLYLSNGLSASTSTDYLFSVPSDGSGAPVRLDTIAIGGGNVTSFRLSSDGLSVVDKAGCPPAAAAAPSAATALWSPAATSRASHSTPRTGASCTARIRTRTRPSSSSSPSSPPAPPTRAATSPGRTVSTSGP